ncbi:nuclear transport factor 2 family protein [Aspergillus undulatus]|uniref:nuclear transport factor 2 family protein n=1 Tax=Aspergillus undulatus TaxID=1810928 RepID=UPI003CCD4359
MADSSTELIMQFVHTFYRLLDGESPEALKEWGDMFDEDAEFVTPVTTLNGRPEIKSQRSEFWTQFPGLTHKPVRMYVSPFSPLDVVVINSYEFTDKDGNHRVSWTACELKLVEREEGRVIQRLEIFMDPTVLGWK